MSLTTPTLAREAEAYYNRNVESAWDMRDSLLQVRGDAVMQGRRHTHTVVMGAHMHTCAHTHMKRSDRSIHAR